MSRLFWPLVCIALLNSLFVARAADEPLIQHTSKECPEGFVLKGKNCESVEILEPKYICPSGTREVDGGCFSYAPIKKSCPIGFTQSGKQCAKVETKPADFFCSDGDLVGRNCKLVLEQPPICPKGFFMDGSGCARDVPMLSKCPSGFQSIGHEKCVKHIKFPASPQCPEGMSLDTDGSNCVRVRTFKPHCPEGYATNKDHSCVRPVPRVAVPCPSGTTPAGSQCLQTEKFPVSYSCPADTVPDNESGKACIKIVSAPPRCPGGMKRNTKTGACEKLWSPKPVCPSGTTLSHDIHCIEKVLVEKVPDCPKGYKLFGEKCKRVQRFPVHMVCEEGTKQRDQCVWTEEFPPMLECPTGFELSKSKSQGAVCARQVEYDCSRKSTRMECEMPEFVSALEDSDDPKVKPDRHLKEVAAPKLRPHSKSPVCKAVPVVIPKTCLKTETRPAQYACPESSVLIGKSCQVKRSTDLVPVCADGVMDSRGRCTKISIVVPNWICPGSGVDTGDARTCTVTKISDAGFVCPAHTKTATTADSGKLVCVEIKHEVIIPDKVIRQPANPVCPTVGIISEDGSVCIKKTFTPRGFVCPSGTVDEGASCYKTTELVQPEPIMVKTPATFICPNEVAPEGRQCMERELVLSDKFCPSEAEPTENGTGCVVMSSLLAQPPIVKMSAAMAVCEDGWMLNGTTCRATFSEEIELSCPFGFDLIDSGDGEGKCAKEQEMKMVCPAGTTRLAESDQCVRSKFVPPQVTVVKKCTKGTPGCH